MNPQKPHIGEVIVFEKIVTEEDLATFDTGTVHRVYSTFALARDAEWTSRLLVLKYKNDDEEGVGIKVTVRHISPAFVNAKVKFVAEVIKNNENGLICRYKATVNGRVIAMGETGQKILKMRDLKAKFEKLTNER